MRLTKGSGTPPTTPRPAFPEPRLASVKASTLAAFIASKKAARYGCSVCRLPQEQQADIEAERAKGASYDNISDGLKNVYGLSVCAGSLRRHFIRGHHEQKDAR